MMRNRRTRVFLAAVLALMFVCVFSLGAFAATGTTKSLSAIFRNIKINVNEALVQTAEEPFIVNGRTYVPLRVIGEALGAYVEWDSATDSVNIFENKDVEKQLQEKDARIAKLEAEIEALKKGESIPEEPDADGEKSLLDLTEKMVAQYGKLDAVKIKDIRFTGNENYISGNIDVDLRSVGKDWEGLTDSKIKSWASAFCLDVQAYYGEGTEIVGKIKDTDSGDTLVEFSKYSKYPMEITYKDKKHRDGKGLDVSEVNKNLENQWYTLEGLRFNLDSVNYITKDREIRLGFDGNNDVTSAAWEAADQNLIKAATTKICKTIADTYIEDATQNPKTVEVKFYDRIGTVLKTWEYNVADGVLR